MLARHFGSLDAIIAASEEELTAVRDIGEKTAQSLREWLSLAQSAHVIARLREAGVNMRSLEEVADRRFEGKTFVLTGALTKFTRSEAEALIAQLKRLAEAQKVKWEGVLVRFEKNKLCRRRRGRRLQAAPRQRARRDGPYGGCVP